MFPGVQFLHLNYIAIIEIITCTILVSKFKLVVFLMVGAGSLVHTFNKSVSGVMLCARSCCICLVYHVVPVLCYAHVVFAVDVSSASIIIKSNKKFFRSTIILNSTILTIICFVLSRSFCAYYHKPPILNVESKSYLSYSQHIFLRFICDYGRHQFIK